MKVLVVYDSTYGNTEKIAQAIGGAINSSVDCQVLKVGDVDPAALKSFDLLILGSPTHGGWFTPEIKALLTTPDALAGVHVAVFDTRTKKSMFGFAGPRIARDVEKYGGKLVAPPEGFIVLGVHGPLLEGELERAAGWAKKMIS
jgi:flavodoxin I